MTVPCRSKVSRNPDHSTKSIFVPNQQRRSQGDQARHIISIVIVNPPSPSSATAFPTTAIFSPQVGKGEPNACIDSIRSHHVWWFRRSWPSHRAGEKRIGHPLLADAGAGAVAADEADVVAERQQLGGN